MAALRICLLIFIAIFHIYALVLEMFLWTKPAGLKTFRMTLEQAKSSEALAKNQGLYNGFLAAGLMWAVFTPQLNFSFMLANFFLICVALAGIFGGITVGKKLFFLQGVPAILGLAVNVLVYANSLLVHYPPE